MKPTVTELLNLLDKPGLMGWANKIGLEGISLKEFRKKATTKGTSLHNQIEGFLRDGIKIENKTMAGNCENFLKDITVLDVESKIETDDYIGRYDIRYSREDNYFIGDFKSSSGVYLDNILQLIAYSEAEDVDNISIIEIPSFKEKIITVKDRRPFIEILKSLSKIHEMKELATWKS